MKSWSGFCWRSRASTRRRDRAKIAPSNRIQRSRITFLYALSKKERHASQIVLYILLFIINFAVPRITRTLITRVFEVNPSIFVGDRPQE
jgi:hypothetical protein